MLCAVNAVSRTKEEYIVDHNSHAEDELNDLDLGDIFLPPNSATECSNGIVIVHRSVDEHVCPSANSAVCTVVNIEEPRKRECNDMMIYMKETQAVLAKHKEDSIDELPHLAYEEAEKNP